jgi:hypothetical protein
LEYNFEIDWIVYYDQADMQSTWLDTLRLVVGEVVWHTLGYVEGEVVGYTLGLVVGQQAMTNIK